MNERYSWMQLASVQIGGAICLPPILVGYELALQFGVLVAFVAIAVGNILLALVALVCSEMTWKNKRTTPDNAGLYLGGLGQKVVSLLLAFSMCSWFAIQTQVVVQDVAGSNAAVGFALAVLFAGSLLYGLKGITRLSDLAVPVMVLTLIIALYCTYGVKEIDCSKGLECRVEAISMVMALAIGICIDMPTFFRHARSRLDSHIGALVTCAIGIPLIESCGVLLFAWSDSTTVMQALHFSSSAFWQVWIGLFLVLAAWTTNTTNLYSAAMAVKSLWPKVSERQVLVYTALTAVIVSQLNIFSNLALVLEVMGVLLAASFGVILGSFITNNTTYTFLAFSAGCLAGFMHLLTGAAVLDAMLVSAIARSLCVSTKQTLTN